MASPYKKNSRPTSQGCALLRDLLQRPSVDLIAMLLQCEPDTVRAYARGIRRPHPSYRASLAPLGIPADSWKTPPTFDAAAQPPVGAA